MFVLMNISFEYRINLLVNQLSNDIMFEMMFYLFRQAIENATDKKEKHVSMCDKQVHCENIQMLERIDV